MPNDPVQTTALIVEDHEMVSEMFTSRLEAVGLRVVGVARSAPEGVALYRKHVPDLVLCDVRLDGGTSGIALTAELVTAYPSARILIVSAEDEGHVIQAALEAGAVGYVSKKASGPELLQAIKEAMEGMTNVADRHTYRRIIETLNAAPAVTAGAGLTPREHEVVRLLAAGRTTTTVLCSELSISANSVRSHIENLMRKMGVHSRAEIVAKAFQLGLVDAPTKP